MSIAQSRRNKIIRIFWKSVCTEQILLSRALPILPDWQWLEILGFCYPITSQDHLLAHQQTLWVKKKPRCNFRCSVHLLHFSDPLLTRVSKATCGQAGDSKSSENWSTRGCPKIQSFQVGSRIETKVCSSKYSSTVDLQKLKIYWQFTVHGRCMKYESKYHFVFTFALHILFSILVFHVCVLTLLIRIDNHD